ncbi:NAD(P)H-dependent flavin oxidoreductase [Longimicrobium sp.]|uniref:NAD(P)H-dependent flavin oxidoreductase n=1 Tax=Longimicrobium sp. TaxID=2029185 RepID=UPI002C6C6D95|nr:nitronate monooxygenase [Longimicrobium sp.]HSU15940.1 nitronate monooxygenase [Longimicrobium sp.]
MAMNPNAFLQSLGIRHPIVLAPMGGGPSTPELVAAVSNAGGLGILGTAYMAPGQIADAIRRIRALTDRPFGVNLFAGAWAQPAGVDAAPMLAMLGEAHARLGIDPPVLPEVPPDPFPAQMEAVLEARPPVFTFTFGIPAPEVMARVREAGMRSWGTATTLAEARLLAEAGADAVIAQGAEAGAHRGTFAAPFEAAMVPTLELVAGIAREVRIPIVAAGGVMDGRDVAAALAAGASAAALGTAFLVTPESAASEAYRRALLDARDDTTVITRAFSGRPARGLRNEWIDRVAANEGAILPYPLQNALTRPMRTAAGQKGEPGFLSLWAGTGVPRARPMPAADLVRTLVAEMEDANGS